jgi:hypothetical protein
VGCWFGCVLINLSIKIPATPTIPKQTKPINHFFMRDELSEGQGGGGETIVGNVDDATRGAIALKASSADW